MKQYDVYGIGNALVDTEYQADDAFLDHAKLTKGIMTLIEEDEREKLIRLLEHDHKHLAVKQAGGDQLRTPWQLFPNLAARLSIAAKLLPIPQGIFSLRISEMRG